MSWLSDWIDKKSGKQDAIDIDAQQERYKTAMGSTNAGYDKMMGIAEQQMDIGSEQNRARLAMMESSSADNAAESARLAQRTAASAGGAPAAAMAFQQQDMANKAQSGVMDQYQRGMFQQQENALGTMGGVLANQGQIAQAGFNMGESAREYNKKVEARARAQKGAMLGGALKIGGGLLMGNPAMALGGASSFLQEGGYIKNYNHGGQVEDPENPKPVGNGMSDDDAMATSMLGMAMGGMTKGKYSPLPGDTVDAKLEPGEYVLNRNAVNAIGKENLDEVNNEKAPRFDKGKVKMRMGGYLYGG
tara:strand:- start:7156 stop:8067 length:912 start_codon:yes stop_codon:yes gene_type:complete